MTTVRESDCYYVYARDTGGCYISERVNRATSGEKYFWVKSKDAASPLTRNAARKVAKRYGGVVRQF